MLDWLREIYAEPLFWLFPVAGTAIGVVAFLAFAGPLTVLAWKQPAGADRYRIQARKTGRRSIVRPAFWHVFRNSSIMGVLTIASWPLLRLTNVHAGPLPAWWVIVLQLLFFIVLDDFLFYWMHRSLHESKWLFKKIHSTHHRIMTPWAVTGNDRLPVEVILTGLE